MAEDENKKDKEEEEDKKNIRPDLSKLGQCCTWECGVDGGTC